MPATRTQILLAWLPAALYMALIWAISSIALPELPIEQVPLQDKGVHFLEYGALGLLVAHATLRTWPHRSAARTLPLAVLITVAWGVLDEIHQGFVAGRSAEVLDIVADTLGAIAGAAARFALRIARRRAA